MGSAGSIQTNCIQNEFLYDASNGADKLPASSNGSAGSMQTVAVNNWFTQNEIPYNTDSGAGSAGSMQTMALNNSTQNEIPYNTDIGAGKLPTLLMGSELNNWSAYQMSYSRLPVHKDLAGSTGSNLDFVTCQPANNPLNSPYVLLLHGYERVTQYDAQRALATLLTYVQQQHVTLADHNEAMMTVFKLAERLQTPVVLPHQTGLFSNKL